MNDRHVRDKLSEYIDGMLSQEEASSVKEHLDRCSDCKVEYMEMVKIIGHMNQMENLETPEAFAEKVHERLNKAFSLHRLVKGLFFPLKIKIPLELAGVAAAALLVIYIVGIREKQHVYELAFVDRSQPLAVLQEQILETEAEIDKAGTLGKKEQPELKLEEEKMEKRDKRVEAEDALTLGKKELPALAPQEKRIERQAKAEEAAPRGKMIKKEGARGLKAQEEPTQQKIQLEAEAPSSAKVKRIEEVPLEIADKEKGEPQKDSSPKETHREEKLQDIITALGGKILESEYKKDTQVLVSVIIEIPAEKYQELIQTLKEQGEIEKPYPTIKEKEQETIQIRIVLQQ